MLRVTYVIKMCIIYKLKGRSHIFSYNQINIKKWQKYILTVIIIKKKLSVWKCLIIKINWHL